MNATTGLSFVAWYHDSLHCTVCVSYSVMTEETLTLVEETGLTMSPAHDVLRLQI